jgi:hypothetical protein
MARRNGLKSEKRVLSRVPKRILLLSRPCMVAFIPPKLLKKKEARQSATVTHIGVDGKPKVHFYIGEIRHSDFVTPSCY